MRHVPDAPDTAEAAATGRSASDDGFRQVFTDHRTRVFRLAVLMTGNVHVAEEVTAEVFARVLPRWRAGGVTDVLSYLRRAVVNETRSRHRRREHEARALARWGAPAAVRRHRSPRARRTAARRAAPVAGTPARRRGAPLSRRPVRGRRRQHPRDGAGIGEVPRQSRSRPTAHAARSAGGVPMNDRPIDPARRRRPG